MPKTLTGKDTELPILGKVGGKVRGEEEVIISPPTHLVLRRFPTPNREPSWVAGSPHLAASLYHEAFEARLAGLSNGGKETGNEARSH